LGSERGNPWRTIPKVNKTMLRPGDVVLLQGTFGQNEPEEEKTSDGELRLNKLAPASSGTALNPITFGPYGAGATLTWGVFIPSHRSWIRIEHLTVDGSSHGGATVHGTQGITSSRHGDDTDIVVSRTVVENVLEGIAAHAASDTTWSITGNTITDTGGSGIEVGQYEGPHEELGGAAFTIEDNRVANTGLAAKALKESGHVHGIYVKASDSKVIGNTVTNFNGSGVTVRFRNSVVEKNIIRHGAEGISFFQFGLGSGKSTWNDNTIAETTHAGIYVSGENALRESFVVTHNKLSKAAGLYLDLNATPGTYRVTRNVPCNVTPPRVRGNPGRPNRNGSTGRPEAPESASRRMLERRC
jgi:hypothetical protein